MSCVTVAVQWSVTCEVFHCQGGKRYWSRRFRWRIQKKNLTLGLLVIYDGLDRLSFTGGQACYTLWCRSCNFS